MSKKEKISSYRNSQVAEFEQKHNCTNQAKLIKKYGQGWLSLKLPSIIGPYDCKYISNSDIFKIEKYIKLGGLEYKHQEFEQENNCIRLTTIFSIYGKSWYYHSDLSDLIIKNGKYAYVRNSDVQKIEQFNNMTKYGNTSTQEKEIVKYLKSNFNFSIEENIRTIIPPFELDIFIPDLKLAIEYNGTYWHSKVDKYYHLNKSILCRNKNIRLVHIYEFEDFDRQLCLLSELIKGNDLYSKDDFNKNNLLIAIPTPELIYDSIYGAGKLF